MNTTRTAIILLLILLQSCNPSNKKAFEFNEKLVAVSGKLQEKGTTLGAALRQAVNTKDFSTVDSLNRDLRRFVEEQKDLLYTAHDVGGSENFRHAMLDFLEFEKLLIDSGFSRFGKMNKDTPHEEIQQAVDTMMAKVKVEEVYLRKVQAAQKEFAEKNGFKIAPSKK